MEMLSRRLSQSIGVVVVLFNIFTGIPETNFKNPANLNCMKTKVNPSDFSCSKLGPLSHSITYKVILPGKRN